ncbi:MAG: hypothetical protein MUE85_17575 [Microscillaceae bacterium]|nr:hypothetical protein [Microscillaceae bacterium]
MAKQIDILKILKNNLQITEIQPLKENLSQIEAYVYALPPEENEILYLIDNEEVVSIKRDFLINEIKQILASHTLERARYYLQRLLKALSEEKTTAFNDLNLNRWKEYDDILTDSLWLFDKRDTSGVHSADYWGNFIPQIPHQLIRRYTKPGEWVLDTFAGSGTTLLECKRLGRNSLGIELQAEVAQTIEKLIQSQVSDNQAVKSHIIQADALELNYQETCNTLKIKQIALAIVHPPYWDIIKFSDQPADLSNAVSLTDFLAKMGKLADKIAEILPKNRYMALVISDKYEKGEWIPLGFYTMQTILTKKFKLKSIVVKNFEDTKGKMNQKELWRYRALAGGFYVFKHEYIFLFQKK